MARLAVLALALAGCATAVVPAELLRGVAPDRKAVVVAMALSPADAYRRVVAAYEGEGLFVAAGDSAGGRLASAPVHSGRSTTAHFRYRATVAGSAGGATVTLTLTVAMDLIGTGASNSPPVSDVDSRPELSRRTDSWNPEPAPGMELLVAASDNDAWRRLQRIADRLRAP
jgi:hypothetical protein